AEKRRPYTCWARIWSSFFETLNLKVATATVSVATAVWREAMSSQGGLLCLAPKAPARQPLQIVRRGTREGHSPVPARRVSPTSTNYRRGGGGVGSGRRVSPGLTALSRAR